MPSRHATKASAHCPDGTAPPGGTSASLAPDKPADRFHDPVLTTAGGGVRATLRRRADPEPFALGDLAIDYDRRQVTVAGRAVELTPTEYELLRMLSLEAGRVVTYRALLTQVWSKRANGSWKVVRAFVKQLRAKLGDDAADPTWIFNVRGVGYRMPRPGETPGS